MELQLTILETTSMVMAYSCQLELPYSSGMSFFNSSIGHAFLFYMPVMWKLQLCLLEKLQVQSKSLL